MSLQDALQRALDQHKPSIVALTEDLIRIASKNPPGVSYAECVATQHQLFGELSGGFRGGTPYPMHTPRPTATP